MAQLSTAGAVAGGDDCGDYRRIFSELCHMVALSRTGKAAQVTEALIERTIVRSKKPLGNVAALSVAVTEIFGVSIPEDDIEAAVEVAVQNGRLRRVKGQYVLDQRIRADVTRAMQSSHDLEKRVRDTWLDEVLAETRKLDYQHRDALWKSLRGYMERVFLEHGALSAELLQVSHAVPIQEDSLIGHAHQAIRGAGLSDVADVVIHAIQSFFDSEDADRNEYIAQHLDATFTIFALSTPSAASSYLRGQMPQLKLLLDTNFIFELVGLHVNPGFNVAEELIRFIQENELPVSLHYHPRTLREARNTLSNIGSKLRSQRWSQPLSRATVATGTAGGVELKYHALNAEQHISPDVFMRRYEEHLPELLAEHGVKLLRGVDDSHSPEETALLVMEYKSHLEKHRPDMEKPYETMDHDAAVLLSLRQFRVEAPSAIHTGALFLTNDRTLQRFDSRQTRGNGAPNVVLPQALLQVLRPFGQASQDANRRFVRSFGIPELRTAHTDYSETADELRFHLAAYDDLSEETAVTILGNELLKARLDGTSDPTEFQNIVESEVVRLNNELIAEREKLKAATEETAERVRDLEAQLSERDSALSEASATTEELSTDLAKQRREAEETRSEQEKLAAQVERLRADQERRDEDDRRRAERQRFTRRAWSAGLVAVMCLALAWWALHDNAWFNGHERQLGIAGAIPLMVLATATAWTIRNWKPLVLVALPAVFILLEIL